MKVKILTENSSTLLEKAINNFIYSHVVVDIKYSLTLRSGFFVYSAMILYKEV